MFVYYSGSIANNDTNKTTIAETTEDTLKNINFINVGRRDNFGLVLFRTVVEIIEF